MADFLLIAGYKMRVGIIGIGAIAQLHIPALLNAGQNIVAICDIDSSKSLAAIEKFNLKANVYEDYKKMLDCEKLDAVHVCTPHYLHAQMVCYALNRNINVLCEKPIAISFEQLDDIKAAVAQSTAKLGVCQQNRFKASMQFVKDYFKDKEITAASGYLCWQRDKKYYESGDWRGKKATEGGGVVINQALHTLDLLQWFCGMPISVIGHTVNDTLKDVIDVEETAFGIFKLKNGGRFVLNATNASATSFPITIMLHSKNDNAVIIDDNIILNGKFLTKSDGLPLFGKEVWGVGHIVLIKDYYDALQSNKKFEIDFEEAKKVVILLLNLYQSNGEEIILER